MARKEMGRLRTILLLVAAALAIRGLSIMVSRPKLPNVLLITVDALRPDHLGSYGYRRNTTPNIDRVAREGARFTEAISQASHTFGSLPSMMTSLYLHTRWSKDWVDFMHEIPDPTTPTLPEILKGRGYHTGMISNYPDLKVIAGIQRNIDDVDIFSNKIGAEKVSRRAISWIEKNRDRPFFLYLHYGDPHSPYRPPPPYRLLYIADGLDGKGKRVPIAECDRRMPQSCLGVIPEDLSESGITDTDYYVSQYDGEIRYTDEHIGMLLDKLRELDLEGNTVVIITADHGEGMGEHGFYFIHCVSLYDELLKVPLIIRYPPLIPGRVVIDRQVRLIDIMPTVLDAAGIKSGKEIEGVSLLPLIRGEKTYFPPYAFSDIVSMRSIRGDGWKLIYYADTQKYELYELRDDPQESRNLADTEKEKLGSLRSKLDDYMSKARVLVPVRKAPLDEEAKESLRALGYLH